MKLLQLAGKTVCVLGYGREGRAMVRAIETHASSAEITIADINEAVAQEKTKHWMQVGTGWLENLEKFDVIIKSPGIPLVPQLEPHKKKITNATQIFLDTISGRGATIIGITGSKGKSTTASLIHAILKEAGKDTLLLGNIGEPSISHVDEVKEGTHVVLEMSSYQLMDVTTSPHIAVITSFFPEHLDYHGSMDAYLDAKKNITKFQTEDDVTFFSSAFAAAAEIAKEGRGKKLSYSVQDAPIAIEKTKLIGRHNLNNIAGAYLVTHHLGVDKKTALRAIKNFKGLPHRLEFIGTFHDLDWVDDAISTTPESTIAAIDALGDRLKTIILGGQDRGYDFTLLGNRIKASPIEHVILFPGSGPRIREAIEKAKAAVTFHEADSMEKAVLIAIEQTRKLETRKPVNNPIILLSTASPSYGMFKNFEDKGEQFQKLLKT